MLDSRTAPYAALLFRVSLGIILIAHACTKIFVFTLPGTEAFFQSVGFPGVLAYPVIAGELFGGLALVLGLLTRLASVLLLPGLLGAASVHIHNGWSFTAPHGGWEYPALLVIGAIVQALLGSGAMSLDGLIAKWRGKA